MFACFFVFQLKESFISPCLGTFFTSGISSRPSVTEVSGAGGRSQRCKWRGRHSVGSGLSPGGSQKPRVRFAKAERPGSHRSRSGERGGGTPGSRLQGLRGMHLGSRGLAREAEGPPAPPLWPLSPGGAQRDILHRVTPDSPLHAGAPCSSATRVPALLCPTEARGLWVPPVSAQEPGLAPQAEGFTTHTVVSVMSHGSWGKEWQVRG